VDYNIFENNFIDEFYTYLVINYDSTSSKEVIKFNESIGLCSFKQSFGRIHYYLDQCNLPNKKKISVIFSGYSKKSIQFFVQDIQHSFDIDDIKHQWDKHKKSYNPISGFKSPHYSIIKTQYY